MHVDEHIGVDAVAIPQTFTDGQMRDMFLAAIELQKDIITQAKSTIKHYEFALSEMAK